MSLPFAIKMPAIRRQMSSRAIRCRRGLAPLEFVLWLPVLLFVTALMVNLGTSQVWRIRGEIVARDVAWSNRWPRQDAATVRPPARVWPASAAMGHQGAGSQVAAMSHPVVNHPVIRGALDPFVVRELLNYDQGEIQGTASISRPFPLLPKLGGFNSGQIVHELLTGEFQTGTMTWINGWGETEPMPWNVFRRIKVLYILQEQAPALAQAFVDVLLALFQMPEFPALWVLDRDTEIRHYYGGYVDFHPRIRRRCELDPEVVRKQEVDRLIDHLQGAGRAELGEISYLPRTMTNFFLNMYRTRVQELQNQIDQWQQAGGAQGSVDGAQAEVDSLLEKIRQLEAFERRLPGIEQRMRADAQRRLSRTNSANAVHRIAIA